LRWRDGIRHGLNTVRRLRQMPEEVRQLRVGSFRDIAIRGKQRWSVFEVEPRIRPEELLEVFVSSLVAGSRHHFIHLIANAFHLAETNLMNFLWRFVCR